MLKSLAEALATFFQNLTLTRLVVVLVGVVISLSAVLFAGDAVTGYSFFWTLNQKTESLLRLHDTAERLGLERSGELEEIYRSLVDDLMTHDVQPSVGAGFFSRIPFAVYYPQDGMEVTGKALSALVLPILFVLAALFRVGKAKIEKKTVFGLLVFSAAAAIVAVLIPTIIEDVPRMSWKLDERLLRDDG